MSGISLVAFSPLNRVLAAPVYQPDEEPPIATEIRQNLEAVLADKNMALDLRYYDNTANEHWRIQINAFSFFPVASCFKAFEALYYFLNTPRDLWQADDGSALYSAVVHSANVAAGRVLTDVAERNPAVGNPIERFNDFLRIDVGMWGGLFSWDWEGSPTVGFTDPRYEPNEFRRVWVDGEPYLIRNVFTAADLARGMDFINRGEIFTQFDRFREAARATKALLSIPAPTYRSPIERVWPGGYMGKDGILPATDVATGRVVNDVGIVRIEGGEYLIAFMSAGENEQTAIAMLESIFEQIEFHQSMLA